MQHTQEIVMAAHTIHDFGFEFAPFEVYAVADPRVSVPRPLVGRKLVEEMEEYYKSLKPEAQEHYSLKLQCAGLSLEEDPYLIKDYSKDTTRDRLGEGCSHVAVHDNV